MKTLKCLYCQWLFKIKATLKNWSCFRFMHCNYTISVNATLPKTCFVKLINYDNVPDIAFHYADVLLYIKYKYV